MSNKPAKQLGLWNIVGLGVGGAIGSGIFVTLGNAIGMTGRSILPITVICVFYMLLAYWYNLAMSGVFVVEGGDYSMKGMLLPPLLTGYGGWTNVIWAFGSPLRPLPNRLSQQPVACSGRSQQAVQRHFVDCLFPADNPGQSNRHSVPERGDSFTDWCSSSLCRDGFSQCGRSSLF